MALRAQDAWLRDPDLAAWIDGARLNAARGIGDHLAEPRTKSALARLFASIGPAIAKLETSLTQTRQAP